MRISNAQGRTLLPSLAIVAVLAAVGAFPLDPSLRFTLVVGMAWAIAAIGLDLFVGYTGQLSFGHAGFVAIGAYVITVLRLETDLPASVAVAAGVVVTAGLAAVLGVAVVRLKTFGVAITTFFFGFLVMNLLTGAGLSNLTGGAAGLGVPDLEVAGVSLTSGVPLYVCAVTALTCAVVLTCNLVDSRSGRALRAIKANEDVAAACGVRVGRAKVMAFVYGCALAAVGGLIYSLAIGYLSPDGFAVHQSVYIFAMLIIGGSGTVGGPVLGAMVLTLLPEYFLRTGDVAAIAFAGAMLVFLVFLPEGLFGLATRAIRFVPTRIRKTKGLKDGDDASFASQHVSMPGPRSSHSERGEPVLTVHDAEVCFGEFVALTGVSLTVQSGAVHAVVGPNGAGKTTLLNALSGLHPVTKGRLQLRGEELVGMPANERRKIGIVRCFQTPTLVPDLDVLENVKLGLYADRPSSVLRDFLGGRVNRSREAELATRARWALNVVGVSEQRQTIPVEELDLSEQKRVEIARGIVGEGQLLVLDEPTAGLSAEEMNSLRGLLAELRDRHGVSILLISHHIGFVTQIADELTVLDYGRVIGQGPPEEVLSRPKIAEIFSGIEPTETRQKGV